MVPNVFSQYILNLQRSYHFIEDNDASSQVVLIDYNYGGIIIDHIPHIWYMIYGIINGQLV